MEKSKMVTKIREIIKDAKGIYFTNFIGMPTAELNAVRKKMKTNGLQFLVVKNRLAAIAFREFGIFDKVQGFLKGPTSLIISQEDVTAPARLLKELAKDYPIKFKGALVEDTAFLSRDFDLLASIPPKPELIGQILNSLLAPLTEFTWQLEGILNEFLFTLEAIANKKQ